MARNAWILPSFYVLDQFKGQHHITFHYLMAIAHIKCAMCLVLFLSHPFNISQLEKQLLAYIYG